MATLALGAAASATAGTAATAGLFGVGGTFSAVQTLSTALTAVSTVASIQSGYAAQIGYKQKADAEEFAAKERELQRLKNLRKVQASQRAIFAGRGIDYVTGSPEAIRRDSINEYFLERGSDLASTSRTINSLNAAGNQAVTNGWVSGAGIIGNRIGKDWG